MAAAIQYGQYSIPEAAECVNFGVGQPAPSLLPLDAIRTASAEKFSETDPLFLQYGYISGYPKFRQSLARFLAAGYGKPVDPELLFATNGISGGLGLLCSLLAGRGDTVIVENPSYFLALSIFRDFGLNIVAVDVDAEGLRTDDLEALLKGGLRPKLVYCIPAFSNPTAVTMTHARREALVALAAQYDFTVLADEVYQLLSFVPEDSAAPAAAALPPPLCYYDTTGHVISMGSFAKIAAPALRLGWFQFSPAGAGLFKRIYGCGQLDSSGGLNPVIAGVIERFIDSGAQEKHLLSVRRELTWRAKVLGDALRASLPPGATFAQPTGGYFFWIRCPPRLTGGALLDVASSRFRVRFHAGPRFGTRLEAFFRLSFSYYSAEDLRTGAERVGAAMHAALQEAEAAAPVPVAPAPASAAPLSIAVHGATGRLGSLILAAAQAEAGGAAGGHTPRVVEAHAIPRGAPVPAAATPGARTVVVDVSLPAGTADLLARLRAGPGPLPPLVVGTTGADLPWDALRAYAAAGGAVAVAANFSAGVPLMLAMLGACEGRLPAESWAAEVVETHHTAKRDAPSGTAKRLVAALDAAGVRGGGVDGQPSPSSIPVHALRLGDVVGTHTVVLGGPGESVEVTHRATRRDVFAAGALRLAAWLATQPPGLYIK